MNILWWSAVLNNNDNEKMRKEGIFFFLTEMGLSECWLHNRAQFHPLTLRLKKKKKLSGGHCDPHFKFISETLQSYQTK